MFRTGLVLKNSRLLAGLTSLHIWGEITQFEIEAVCNSLPALLYELDEKPFDLLIIEDQLISEDDYRSLQAIRSHRSCRHIALCSNGDSEDYRDYAESGVADIFTLPFREDLFLALFDRIRAEDANVHISTGKRSETKDTF